MELSFKRCYVVIPTWKHRDVQKRVCSVCFCFPYFFFFFSVQGMFVTNLFYFILFLLLAPQKFTKTEKGRQASRGLTTTEELKALVWSRNIGRPLSLSSHLPLPLQPRFLLSFSFLLAPAVPCHPSFASAFLGPGC